MSYYSTDWWGSRPQILLLLTSPGPLAQEIQAGQLVGKGKEELKVNSASYKDHFGKDSLGKTHD